jgi:phosphatidylinositol alpha-1,6-mannosyltransferase
MSGVDAFVKFVIAPERVTLASLYKEADLFALPVRASEDDVEGFGIVFLEAALFALPSVSTRAGGIPEAVLDGVTGTLVDPDSDGELHEALKKLLSDPEAAARMGEAAKVRVLRDFRWETRAEAFLERLA